MLMINFSRKTKKETNQKVINNFKMKKVMIGLCFAVKSHQDVLGIFMF